MFAENDQSESVLWVGGWTEVTRVQNTSICPSRPPNLHILTLHCAIWKLKFLQAKPVSQSVCIFKTSCSFHRVSWGQAAVKQPRCCKCIELRSICKWFVSEMSGMYGRKWGAMEKGSQNKWVVNLMEPPLGMHCYLLTAQRLEAAEGGGEKNRKEIEILNLYHR